MLHGEQITPSRPAAPTFPSQPVRTWENFPEQPRRWRTPSDGRSSVLPTELDWGALLNGISTGRSNPGFGANRIIFTQGESADALFFVLQGQVKLTVVSPDGKGAIVATLGPGDFFGEGCLIGQSVRMATATSMGGCRLTRIEKPTMVQVLHKSPGLAEAFIAHLLSRIVRYEADLVDQMFNSSEKRLARVGQDGKAETVVTGVSQEHLAQMVGSTRPRINHFMTKFRKLGFIAYSNGGGLTVHRSLQRVIEAD